MGSQDVKQSEKEDEEKVEKEKKDELQTRKGKLPGLFGEVTVFIFRCSFRIKIEFQILKINSLALYSTPLPLLSIINHKRTHGHFDQNQVRSLIVLAVPLFLSSASWVRSPLFGILTICVFSPTQPAELLVRFPNPLAPASEAGNLSSTMFEATTSRNHGFDHSGGNEGDRHSPPRPPARGGYHLPQVDGCQ